MFANAVAIIMFCTDGFSEPNPDTNYYDLAGNAGVMRLVVPWE